MDNIDVCCVCVCVSHLLAAQLVLMRGSLQPESGFSALHLLADLEESSGISGAPLPERGMFVELEPTGPPAVDVSSSPSRR